MTTLMPLLIVIAIMAAGGASQRWCSSTAERLINQYVYYLAFPAILFMSLKQTPFEQILNGRFVLGYSAALVLVYVLVYVRFRGQTPKVVDNGLHQPKSAALHALAATFGNTAFIGIPFLAVLFPSNKLAMLAAALASLLSVFMFAVTVVLLRLSHEQLNKSQQILLALRVCGRNPIVMGALLGITASFVSLSLPPWLNSALWGIGISSSPCALFAIGVALARSLRESQSSILSAAHWQVLAAKLILLPLLIWLIFSLLNIDNSLTKMAILLSAMPSAASVYLLAYQHQTAAKPMAQIIVMGTILSLLVLPALTFIIL